MSLTYREIYTMDRAELLNEKNKVITELEEMKHEYIHPCSFTVEIMESKEERISAIDRLLLDTDQKHLNKLRKLAPKPSPDTK